MVDFYYYTEDVVTDDMLEEMVNDSEVLNVGIRKQFKKIAFNRLSKLLGERIRGRADVVYFTKQMKLIEGVESEKMDDSVTRITVKVDDIFVEAWKISNPLTMGGKIGDKVIEKILKKAMKDYVKLCKPVIAN